MVEKKSGVLGNFWVWIAGVFSSERLRGALRNAFIDDDSGHDSAELISIKESEVRASIMKEFSEKFHFVPKKSLRNNKSDNKFWAFILLLILLSTLANVVLIFFWKIILPLWRWIAGGVGIGVVIIILLFLSEKIIERNNKIFKAPFILGSSTATFATGWNSGLQEFSIKFLPSFKNIKIFVKRSTPKGLHPNARVYEWFSLSVLGALHSDISEASYKFRVSKKWLSKAGVEPESVSLFFRTANSWKSSPAKNIGSDDKSYFFDCSGNFGFGICAIGVKNSLLKKRVWLAKKFASTISKTVSNSFREISEMFSHIRSIVPWKELIIVLFIALILFGFIILY
ncbi:PGF-pre-PGF domain-containing protein, partial [Candidatus Woesearchaeota archaeon]|nr:PGF-pre-PGF domain-containing protein [Candidatus Woesearchaeota archaeon]